jgi:hypothetical protein
MDKLSNFLNRSLAKKGLLHQARGAQVCFYAGEWKDLPFSPISFSRGILKVSVTSPSLAAELKMREDDLLDFINRKMNAVAVRSLRIMNYS